MICIVSHNGKKWLEQLLPSLGNLPYTIIDNQSDDPETIEYINDKPMIEGNGGWCIGGYIKAVENIKADWYFFMHDSMVVKNPNFLDKFQQHDVCGWLSFPMAFDNPEQEAYIRSMYNLTEKGCFGPIFYATREAIESISWDKPETIDQAHGMERGIACAFKEVGYDMKFIDELNEQRLSNNEYEDFVKCRPQRA